MQRCPRCGNRFDCGRHRPVSDPCWCVRPEVPADVLARLAATYAGCLCPGCFRETTEA